jgi:hypothetical protein
LSPYLEKPFTKIGLAEWLHVKALSSSLHATYKKSNNNTKYNQKTVLMGLSV